MHEASVQKCVVGIHCLHEWRSDILTEKDEEIVQNVSLRVKIVLSGFHWK